MQRYVFLTDTASVLKHGEEKMISVDLFCYPCRTAYGEDSVGDVLRNNCPSTNHRPSPYRNTLNNCRTCTNPCAFAYFYVAADCGVG